MILYNIIAWVLLVVIYAAGVYWVYKNPDRVFEIVQDKDGNPLYYIYPYI